MNEPPGARARVALTGASGRKPLHADVTINDPRHAHSLPEASAEQDRLSAAKATQMTAWCGYSLDMNLCFDQSPSSTVRLELKHSPGDCCCSCSAACLAWPVQSLLTTYCECAGLAVAEHFRDAEGQDVLLFIDNIFRFTQVDHQDPALLGFRSVVALLCMERLMKMQMFSHTLSCGSLPMMPWESVSNALFHAVAALNATRAFYCVKQTCCQVPQVHNLTFFAIDCMICLHV